MICTKCMLFILLFCICHTAESSSLPVKSAPELASQTGETIITVDSFYIIKVFFWSYTTRALMKFPLSCDQHMYL